MKKKRLILAAKISLMIVMSFVLFTDKNAKAADSCSTQKPGFTCVNINQVSGETGCVTGLCPGGNEIKCCKLPETGNGGGDRCATEKPGFSCVNTNQVSGETGCVTGLCPGAAEVKCCRMPSGNGNGNNGSGSPTEFTNPLEFDSVDAFLSNILGALQKIIVTLSLLMVVYGAVMYTISGGGKQVEDAKKIISAALVGLAIGIAAPSFLKEIANILRWRTDDTQLASALSLTQIALNVLNFLLGILGIISIIMLIVGAMYYLTSAGDTSKAETGKKIFVSSIIGIAIAMASLVLVTQVGRILVGS